MSRSIFPAFLVCLIVLSAFQAPALGQVRTDKEWSDFKSSLWKDLWGEYEGKRVKAVQKLGTANYHKAVQLLVDIAKLPNPRLYPLQKEKNKLLGRIESIGRVVMKNKGMITLSEKADLERMQARVKNINEMLFKEAGIRRDIVLGLGATTDAKSLAWIYSKGIKEKSTPARMVVVEALGHITDDGAVAALLEAVQDKSAQVRTTAVDALARKKGGKALDAILEAIKDETWQVRAAAVAALNLHSDLKMVEPLIGALKNEVGRLRGDIDALLKKLLGRTMGGDYDLWRSWWEAHKVDVLSGKDTSSHGGGAKALKTTSFYGIKTHSKNVMFIIDISGSMRFNGAIPESDKKRGTGVVGSGGGEGASGPEPIGSGPTDEKKISIAKWELKKAIASLEKGAKFNIIYYSSEVNVYSPTMVKSSKAARRKVYAVIDKFEAIGGTNIYDSLMQAFDLAAERKGKRGRKNGARGSSGPAGRSSKKAFKESVDTIFFLTDGFATAGEVLDPDGILQSVRDQNRTRKIIIHTIGIYDVGPEAAKDPTGQIRRWKRFLEQLAAQNGGKHTAIGDMPGKKMRKGP